MIKEVEICVGSYADAKAAIEAGAKGVELNSALYLGGLTPSLGTLALVKKEYPDVHVVCMVRPRGGGFHYDEDEIHQMFIDAGIFLQNGADAIAFGFLNEDGTIDEETTKKMVELIHKYDRTAIFDRAFDVTNDLFASAETCVRLGVDRILTSGGADSAPQGIGELTKLQEQFGEQIEFLPGGGIRAGNVSVFKAFGFSRVHSSCTSLVKDHVYRNGDVSFSYREDGIERVDVEKVKALLEAAYE